MDKDTEMVWFTTKGQVVIPSSFRKRFGIEEGTRAIVSATDEGIVLKPVTATSVRRVRGILKRKAPAGAQGSETVQSK